MPCRKSIRTLFLETVLFVTVFAIISHLSVNIWEKFVIQNELCKMKVSLHSLKEHIKKIGNEYDNLNKELKGIEETAENHAKIKPVIQKGHKYSPDSSGIGTPSKKAISYKDASTLDRITVHDMQIQSMSPTKDKNTLISAPLKTAPNIDNENNWRKNEEYIMPNYQKPATVKETKDTKSGPTHTVTPSFSGDFNPPVLKNMSTMRYPLKSTGVNMSIKFYPLKSSGIATPACKIGITQTEENCRLCHSIHKCDSCNDTSYSSIF